jgi:single-strand DNA-binding protein
MALEVTGKLHEIYPAQQVSDRFRKREFVLEFMDGNYAQYVKLQLNQDRCDLIDSYNKGENIKVSFNLSGRQFTDRNGQTQYFTNLVAWRIEAAGGSGAPAEDANYSRSSGAAQPSYQGGGSKQGSGNFASTSDDDDLPF